jgi:Lon-like ATP-dependent protease
MCIQHPYIYRETFMQGSTAAYHPAFNALAHSTMAVAGAVLCREAGVRNLKKHLEKIYRKAAFKLVQQGAKLVAVEPPAAAAAADAADADKQQPEQEQEAAAAADAAASSADSSSSSSSLQDAAAESSSSSGTTLQVVYEGDPINIGDGDLKEYVGLPPFAQDKFYDTTPAGVVMGLAWTAMGGATLYVEAAPIVDVSGSRRCRCCSSVA